MALIEEMNKSGNWLFRWRSFLPLALYVLAAIVIGFELDKDQPLFHYNFAFTCVAVSLFGQLIRALTIGFTPKGTSGRNTKEGQVAESLNNTGIYSLVRHPLYLGNFFMWMGLIMYVGSWWFTISCTFLFWVYYERIMFAEEFFLRGKFGQTYLNWAEKTPAFFPNFKNFVSAPVFFSFKNVMKREYNGFFAIFLSFTLIDAMKNYIHLGFYDWKELVHPFWQYSLVGAFAVFLLLRSLKKYTKVLDVEGREYIHK